MRHLLASRALEFAGVWPLHDSVKFCFACGMHEGVTSQCLKKCCSLTSARAPRSTFGRCSCCVIEPCELLRTRDLRAAALELEPCVPRALCVLLLLVAASGFSLPRGLRRRSPRGDSLRPAVEYILIVAFVKIHGAFAHWSGRGGACVCPCFFQRICRSAASKPRKFSGLAGANGHRGLS